VPPGGAGELLQAEAEKDSHPVARQTSLRTPYLPLPANLDELLARTDAKFRANVRRRRRKLDEKGEVKLTRITTHDPAVLQRFLDLEKAGWKGSEGTAIDCDPATRRFYELVSQAAAEGGYLCMYLLTCGDQDVAIHFGLEWKGRYFVPKPAYHEGYRECSPGQLIVLEVLRDAIERGLTEFDFLGPMMDWKQDWAPEVREHAHLWILRGGPLGRALHAARFKVEAALRQTGKQLLKGKGK
jgi:CelD/BcsL family acetyltransferase involved in cellulose biosynthesis